MFLSNNQLFNNRRLKTDRADSTGFNLFQKRCIAFAQEL